MNKIQEQVQTLITEACCHPAESPERQKRLTQIIRSISGRLWKENVPYYQDALQQTWIYFCQNLCESKTGRSYDPQKAAIVTWLNAYLKHRLQDSYIALQTQKARRVSHSANGLGEDNPEFDPINRLEAKPEIPPLLAEVQLWAETTPQLQKIYIKERPDITCRFLILKRLPPETPWKVLSTELDVSIGTLSSFYQRQCLPLLREFGRTQGYL